MVFANLIPLVAIIAARIASFLLAQSSELQISSAALALNFFATYQAGAHHVTFSISIAQHRAVKSNSIQRR
jgi:hypothetical protein